MNPIKDDKKGELRLNNKKFYIISLKWTYPESAAFTLWRPDNSGYCWYKDWAGVYTEEQLDVNYNNDGVDTFAVDAKIVDKLWTRCIYDRKEVQLLLNTKENRRKLGIKKKSLQGGMSNILWRHITILDEGVKVA